MIEWATFTETVLFISKEEKEDFLKRYLQKTDNCSMSDDEFQKILAEGGGLKQLHTDTIFGVNVFDAESTGGGVLCAFDDSCMDENDLDGGFYIVTDHQTTPIALLRDRTYESLEDIIDKFKSYAGPYLPEDFDWIHHTGTLYYSMEY